MIMNSILGDTVAISRQILSTCGPGRILSIGRGSESLVMELLKQGVDAYGVVLTKEAAAHANLYAPNRFIVSSILDLPFSDNSFETLISIDYFEHILLNDVEKVLKEMYRICQRFLYLRITYASNYDNVRHLNIKSRAWWENSLFEIGFRKHPAYYVINPFESLDNDRDKVTIPLEKISSSAIKQYPLSCLSAERNLHMDMSRETGTRSDAHMARYTLAAEWIRGGDTVLDCACGLGYGSALLAAISKGKRFIGVDIDDNAISYANENFSKLYNIEYRKCDAECLFIFPDSSIDTLVSFETLEHLTHFENFLKEAHRIVRPDGRMIICVPNLWIDETGNDPNPYHHHVFDYKKIHSSLESHGFFVEARYFQSVPNGVKGSNVRYKLEQFPLSLNPTFNENIAEWWILVASFDPLNINNTTYSHPDFDRSNTGSGFHVADFATNYSNPWLYRSLIQIGERLRDKTQLLGLARRVIATSSPYSADYGGAIAILGYQLLSDKMTLASEIEAIINQIDMYLENKKDNPHILRWHLSLAFLSGLLMLKIGNRERAINYFLFATKIDFSIFSPLLATKTIAAYFWAGILQLNDGKKDAAIRCFLAGVETGRKAVHLPDENAIGNPLNPLTFGFPELGEVADMAGQCANAIHFFDEFERSPSKFWNAIDIKRFGLVSWAIHLESTLKEIDMKYSTLLSSISLLWYSKIPFINFINKVLHILFGIRFVRARMLDHFLQGDDK